MAHVPAAAKPEFYYAIQGVSHTKFALMSSLHRDSIIQVPKIFFIILYTELLVQCSTLVYLSTHSAAKTKGGFDKCDCFNGACCLAATQPQITQKLLGSSGVELCSTSKVSNPMVEQKSNYTDQVLPFFTLMHYT